MEMFMFGRNTFLCLVVILNTAILQDALDNSVFDDENEIASVETRSLSKCSNFGSKSFCHRNRNMCGKDKVKWSCQRTCNVGISRAGNGRIVGGSAVTPHSHPWQVSLVFRGDGRFPFCGGTLISDRHVLTAAHCVKGETAKAIHAIVGDHNWEEGATGTAHTVKSIQPHKRYKKRTFDFDYALLTLNEAVSIEAKHQPACLPTAGSWLFKDNRLKKKRFTVSGWGALRENGDGPSKLHSVNVPFVKWKLCKKLYKKKRTKVTWRMLCAGNVWKGGIDACQGDSGGPLVLKNVPKNRVTLMGVVSWGVGCAKKRKPGVYSDTRRILNWITSKM